MKGYKLVTQGTASANAAASIKITKKGTLKALNYSLEATGGAGVGRMCYELSKQNVSSVTINDAPETVITAVCLALGNATSTDASGTQLLGTEVDVGDTIYVNITLSGTAPSSAVAQFFLVST